MPTRRLLLLTWTCLLAVPAEAGPPFSQLPEDGAWVKFYVTVTGTNVDLVLETTVKSVGRTQVAGENCRWIEVSSVDTVSGERLDVFKLLFKERDLQAGDASITNVVRAWILPRDSDQPMEADDARLAGLRLLFPGELEDVEQLDDTEAVDWQQGRLECAVVTGRTTASLGDQTLTVSHRLLLHEDVPFGLAGFRKEATFDPADIQVVADAQLMNIGDDAQSELPGAL